MGYSEKLSTHNRREPPGLEPQVMIHVLQWGCHFLAGHPSFSANPYCVVKRCMRNQSEQKPQINKHDQFQPINVHPPGAIVFSNGTCMSKRIRSKFLCRSQRSLGRNAHDLVSSHIQKEIHVVKTCLNNVINNPWLGMVYTTYFWWFRGWLIVVTTLVRIGMVICSSRFVKGTNSLESATSRWGSASKIYFNKVEQNNTWKHPPS